MLIGAIVVDAFEVHRLHILVAVTFPGLYLHIHKQILGGGEGDVAQCLHGIEVDISHLVLVCLLVYSDQGIELGGVTRHGQHLHIGGFGTQFGKLDNLFLAVSHYLRTHFLEVAHALLGLYPRASALRPAGTVEDANLDTQFACALECRMGHLPPFGREHLYLAGLHFILPDVAYIGTCDTSLLHRLQVVLHALHRDIVAHPIPIDSHPLVVGNAFEAPCQRVGQRGASHKAAQTKQSYGDFPCNVNHFVSVYLVSCPYIYNV